MKKKKKKDFNFFFSIKQKYSIKETFLNFHALVLYFLKKHICFEFLFYFSKGIFIIENNVAIKNLWRTLSLRACFGVHLRGLKVCLALKNLFEEKKYSLFSKEKCYF